MNNDVPRPGMIATVRNRRGVIASVEPFDGQTGRIHLVDIEYKDNYAPDTERILWEREPNRDLLEPTALPDPTQDPMPPKEFDALLRAARWTALSPYLDPDGDGPLDREPISSPFHGGVRVEDYQLVPLLKALRMPRVSLLIADDVGLGKTVEAGLILTELLLRRRIRRILVLTPASLRQQWQDELWEKFSLRFKIIDRSSTEKLRRDRGIDANPWRSFDRIVASYHYLRQPDVREQFLSACHTPENSPHLPWDLLIVDECHNLMPSSFGEDSELCKTLGLVAPRFEHRLFLSATPHNGHTRSFTGLLEMLDPVRFTRTHEMKPAMRGRINDIMIRRLKRQINAGSATPRFCTRHPPKSLELNTDPRESALSEAFDAFRSAIRNLITEGTKQRRRAGIFAVEILGKRLLSCPTTFAESWSRTRRGFREQDVSDETELAAAERSLRQETGDDRETEKREANAAATIGAWLKNFSDDVKDEINRIEKAIDELGFDLNASIVEQTPCVDVRFDTLVSLIENLLRKKNKFRDDERLIVFTEYKTTLDYVARRLREKYPAERILTLFGAGGQEGMDESERENVKAAFNNPGSPVRVLIATDAASEGLNLHQTARYLLHYDCPWNPSRLEQRNGRLDRYGQARDVTVHHFVSSTDPDLRFIDCVIRKADEIREDLGSVNEVFDRATYRRLIQGEDAESVKTDMYAGLDAAQESSAIEADETATIKNEAASDDALLDAMSKEIDLDSYALGDTLEAAMISSSGRRPQLEVGEEPGCYRVTNPELPHWRDIIDETVRRPSLHAARGPMPQLAFDTKQFIKPLGSLSVFLPRKEVLLIHLAHPLMQRALSLLTQCRYPGNRQVSRWTVRRGDGEIPKDADAAILFSIEEIAVNELRETFHRWVRTVVFPVQNGILGEPLPHIPAHSFRGASVTKNQSEQKQAGEILEEVNGSLRKWLEQHQKELTDSLQNQLESDGKAARGLEENRYKQRQGELSKLIEETTIAKLTREIKQLQERLRQRKLLDEAEKIMEIERSIKKKEEEIERRRSYYKEIKNQLKREHERTLKHLLPKRFAMSGNAQVFPVTVEIRFPEQQP